MAAKLYFRAGINGSNGANILIKDAAGNMVHATMKGTFTRTSYVVPEYVWVDGNIVYHELKDALNPSRTNTLAQLLGSKNEGRACIVPVKYFTAIQPL